MFSFFKKFSLLTFFWVMNMGINIFTEHDFDKISEIHKQFLAQLPNQTLIQGILERRLSASILCIENEPAYVLIRANFLSMTILAGQPSQKQLEKIVQLLSSYEKTTLICADAVHSFFREHGYRQQSRIAFESPIGTDSSYKLTLPEGLVIQLIDSSDLFKKCLWADRIATLWGNAENFIQNSFASVLVTPDGAVIAEAYGAWIGDGLCEIGVVTHPDFQGKGFSTLVTQHLMNESFKRNLVPVWSCNCENIASRKVALKCGFKIKDEYVWLIKETK